MFTDETKNRINAAHAAGCNVVDVLPKDAGFQQLLATVKFEKGLFKLKFAPNKHYSISQTIGGFIRITW